VSKSGCFARHRTIIAETPPPAAVLCYNSRL